MGYKPVTRTDNYKGWQKLSSTRCQNLANVTRSVSACSIQTFPRADWPSPDVEFLRVVPEGSEAHTEHLGRLHLNAARALERQRDVMAVEILAARFEVEPLAKVR